MAKIIEYFLAPQSPWTYLGHDRLVAIAKKHGAQIDIKPMDLGKVFGVSGGLPLAKRPAQRQAYRLVELKRWSEHLQLPLNLHPAFFPVPGDAAAKLIIAARLAHGTDAALTLAGVIMRGVWAGERNIADEGTLAAMATECGMDGGMLIKSAGTAGVQAEYDRNTEEAIRADVFGSPWYRVEGEGFWGQDRLEFVERAVGG
ncbi:2-hydroxychromene-2-carboxylate isomerase [Noviherbaspirillum galbum]|uniref:2-hydroxychromene-2-carboxylate isomerase n=1 Tax=Noviherbaspirillum galbum TaxID=2709383 RepID=A0A6B3SN22_9BURK|nr:2-hydroxychromene-2-carboxylate isomerase [Noviherbaspirillum galbum]NEX60735.1 2-hydroxychromene-2-carboxylate isomerase [Noviherbaspirillum galbum]